MKLRPAFLFFVLITVVLSACANSITPTLAPPNAASTLIPPGSGDPFWNRIKSSGRIVFGTSANYAPFEYYDNNFQIVGFDAALARELGARLGLQVEIRDFAFESLIVALQAGQIDAIIAAISVTPERQAQIDFSNVYYSGQEVILGRQASGIGKIVAPTQLGQYRVGVERGSVYQTWIQTSLVNSGLMSPVNLLAYERPEDAVRDLRENRNDIVVMDSIPGQEYVSQGGLEVLGAGLYTQLFAIGLPKGASIFQTQLNQTLSQLQNDGTVTRLVSQQLNVILGSVPPTPLPVPTFPPVVVPTAAPAACYDNMAFVADLTIPDDTVLNPRQDFDKIWRFQNTGTCTWDASYRIIFAQGDPMEGSAVPVRGTVRPGETYDMSIRQRSPSAPGRYGGLWQMVNGQNIPFGPRVWVRIRVPGAEPPPTAIPQPTAIPPVQPTLPTAPVIDYFQSSANSLSQGNVITLSWSFSGQSLASSRLTRTNPDGSQTPLYGGADVTSPGSYDDLAGYAGIYTYSLSVSSEFGGTTVKTLSVTVNSP